MANLSSSQFDATLGLLDLSASVQILLHSGKLAGAFA